MGGDRAGIIFARLASSLLECGVRASQQRALLHSLSQALEPAASTPSTHLSAQGEDISLASLSPLVQN